MVCASTKLSMLNIFKPLIITLWIGGMWCVGYLVTPILFANLPDKMLAGMIAGKLFYIMGIIGISAPIILFFRIYSSYSSLVNRNWTFWNQWNDRFVKNASGGTRNYAYSVERSICAMAWNWKYILFNSFYFRIISYYYYE